MHSKKNKFCMQYCKPRYFSTTDDKKYKRFRPEHEYFIDNSLVATVLQTVLFAFVFCPVYLLTTDRQTVIYYSTIRTVELICFDSNTQEMMKKQLYLSDSSNFPPLH